MGNHFINERHNKHFELILNPNCEIACLATSRLNKWVITIGDFDYENKHRRANVVSGVLSRFPENNIGEWEDSSFPNRTINHHPESPQEGTSAGFRC